MIPCKESLVELEKLAKRQKLMYEDALDLGVPYAEVHLPSYRNAVKELMDFYKYKAHKWASGKSIDLFIPFEFDEGHYVGVNVKVSGITDPNIAGGGFINIEIVRGFKPPSRTKSDSF